jgi:TRAP-type mannitol/chloroaromatic compound transport system permease large subunit
MVLLESIFMIRGGYLGEDFSYKLTSSIVAIILVIFDKKRNKRLDYFWIFLFGTVIWASIEALLQLSGTRVMPDRMLYGIELPLWISIPIQGIAEGSYLAVLGIFIADLVLDENTKKYGIIFLVVIIVISFIRVFIIYGVETPNIGGDVASRRNVFGIGAVILVGGMCGLAVYWLATAKPETRKRGLYMFLFMLIISSFWIIFNVFAGQKWVEIGVENPDGTYSNLRRAPLLIEIAVLVYDIFFEIALIYVPFLAIPYILGLIKEE